VSKKDYKMLAPPFRYIYENNKVNAMKYHFKSAFSALYYRFFNKPI